MSRQRLILKVVMQMIDKGMICRRIGINERDSNELNISTVVQAIRCISDALAGGYDGDRPVRQ